ncbi:MAG: ribosome-associated translation inhibitor RaiA [Gammaproteobacteria bacterium]|nr:ribosome-associated translation inhibitor RaiA [Gammaproteobacteria bacterium]MDE0714371.1 ribosome-associated translation inhibitor RaiA [Gammaproteobacteria bacterium]MXY64632.1 ribosome-associated translation inhibitor RaiA [Gammaproteobacteria bacterium]MYG66280.1 ribosome-associated translation inhibitor RaiA [Gammaproteobacteria bacterium]MYH90415.1 ribosome-associated translation inhibitor RaiA [Gammaproteobacteria bacterium]
MQISISGHHVDITDSMHHYVSGKVEKIVRHFDHVTNTNVILQVEKKRHMAEATINTKGAMIHASSTCNDMYAAIDSMVNKLDRQVLKHKEKLTDHHRTDAALNRGFDLSR